MPKRFHESPAGFLKDPVILGVIAINAGVALLGIFPIFPPNTTYLIVELYVLIPISLLGVIAPWVGLPRITDGREKLFWGLWSLSLAVHLTIRTTYLVLPELDFARGGSVAVDLLYALFYVPLILSVLVRPDQPTQEVETRETRALEFGGTAVFILAVLTYFILIPHTFNRPEYETWVPSILMYWVFDAFLLLSLFYLRETSRSREWRVLYSWLAMAPACWVITEMLELSIFLDPGSDPWPSSFLDVLWYIPWIAITLAGRMRTRPFPALFGAGHREMDRSDLNRSLGRPGWLLVAALALPVIHFGSSLLGLLDPSTLRIREAVVLVSLVVLLGMGALHQKILEARTLDLARRSRESEKREKLLAAAVEQSPDAVLIADAQGVVQYGNRSYVELEGGVERFIGTPLLSVLPEELAHSPEGSVVRSLSRCMAEGDPWEERTSSRGKQGAGREEHLTVSPVRDADGSVAHWVLIRRDVTYLDQLERQFRRAQRMEAVGALAGGIANDFNDLIGKIFGYGEFLKGELGEDSPYFGELRGVLAASERAEELVSQVLAFSRKGEEDRSVLNLGAVVREALALLRPTIPPYVRLVEKIEGGEASIRGVSHQIRQLVLNLGSNAIHAMDGRRGTLTVAVEAGVWGEAEAKESGLEHPGEYLLMSVRDEGPGMEPATLDRIFDPFFTTKGMGVGTGLGLYLVKETVTAHGGVIQVESKPGSGTLVRVFFPVEAGLAPPASTAGGPRVAEEPS